MMDLRKAERVCFPGSLRRLLVSAVPLCVVFGICVPTAELRAEGRNLVGDETTTVAQPVSGDQRPSEDQPVSEDPRGSEDPRVWEINGIRLEPDQVERLADDMARRTVQAVVENVADIELSAPQRERMLEIYRSVSLDTYADIVLVVNTSELDEAAKEARVRELVLAGQERSHDLLRDVLDPAQLERYAVWEQTQVDAYKNARWDRRRRRRRR